MNFNQFLSAEREAPRPHPLNSFIISSYLITQKPCTVCVAIFTQRPCTSHEMNSQILGFKVSKK